jgi:cobalamin biosynthesis protein CobT
VACLTTRVPICATVRYEYQNVELDRSLAAYDQDYIYGTSDVTYSGLSQPDDVDNEQNNINNDAEQNNNSNEQDAVSSDSADASSDAGDSDSQLEDEQQQVQRVEQEDEVEVEGNDISGDVADGDSPLKVRTSKLVAYSVFVIADVQYMRSYSVRVHNLHTQDSSKHAHIRTLLLRLVLQ